MVFKALETVVLSKDLPEHDLHRGDLGAIVTVYGPDALEVEFVTANGHTRALVTLTTADVRRVRGDDVVTVRKTKNAA